MKNTFKKRMTTNTRKHNKLHDPVSSAASNDGRLEQTINYTNLTDFRSSLLNIIPKLQQNEYLRFIITKHGEPAAVIMSHEAYLLMLDATNKVVEQESRITPEEDLREAYEEMTGKKLGSSSESAEVLVTTGRTIPAEENRRVADIVRLAVQEYIKATS